MNAANANVGQNATMWPSTAGTNSGKLHNKPTNQQTDKTNHKIPFHVYQIIACFLGPQQALEQIQSASKAQVQVQQPQQAPAQQPQVQHAAGR